MSPEAWGAVMDRLLAGFAHDANGRATALRGVAILAADEEAPENWSPLLEHEAERLERLAAGLSALRVEAAEPLDAHEALCRAGATLSAVHLELHCEPARPGDSLAVRASRGELVRTVVALAFHLIPPHTAGTLRARAERAGAEVQLSLGVAGETRVPATAITLPGGRIDAVPGGYRVSLPALGS